MLSMGRVGGRAGKRYGCLTVRHGRREEGCGVARFVTGMFRSLDNGALGAGPQGLALGNAIPDAAWRADVFIAEERRSLWHTTAPTEGIRVDITLRS